MALEGIPAISLVTVPPEGSDGVEAVIERAE
jgi:hypothetical protein